MKLWLLNRRTGADYDEYLGFVVRAGTEDEARRIAWTNTSMFESHREDWWLEADQTTCVGLLVAGEPGVILASFKAG